MVALEVVLDTKFVCIRFLSFIHTVIYKNKRIIKIFFYDPSMIIIIVLFYHYILLSPNSVCQCQSLCVDHHLFHHEDLSYVNHSLPVH